MSGSPSQSPKTGASQASRRSIALTGNIAAGKSTVSRMLVQYGCPVIDADTVAHGLYARRPDLVANIAKRFGAEILDAQGKLDRKVLGEKVFGHAEAMHDLEALVHPVLLAELEKLCQDHDSHPLWVLDAALIGEWGWAGRFTHVIFVTAPDTLRLERLAGRNGLSPAAAQERLSSQLSQEKKGELLRAQNPRVFEIRNDAGLGPLEKRVEKALEWVKEI